MIQVNKSDYSIAVDLKSLICSDCGDNDFNFQMDKEGEVVVYDTQNKGRDVILGVDCLNCKCGFSLELKLPREEL